MMKKRTLFVTLGLVISLGAMYAEESDCGDRPSIEKINPITAHSATIVIQPGNDTQTTFRLLYHKSSDFSQAAYRKDTIHSSIVTLTGLEANTSYDIEVCALCGNDRICGNTGRRFTTSEEGEPAEPCSKGPSIYTFQNITHHSATVILQPGVDTQSKWLLFYHKSSDFSQGAYRKDTVTSTSYQLKKLEPNTSYSIEVCALCGEEHICGNIGRSFTTLEAPQGTGVRPAKDKTAPAIKQIEDGQLIILRDGKRYNILGGK